MVLEIDQTPMKGLSMRWKRFFRLLDWEFWNKHVKNHKMEFKMYRVAKNIFGGGITLTPSDTNNEFYTR